MTIESQSAVAPETADVPAGDEVDEVQAFMDRLASGGGTTRHEFPIGPATTPNGMRLDAALLLLAHVLPLLVRANRHVPLYVGHQIVLRADGTFAVCKHPYPKLPRKRIDEHAKLIRAACDHRNQRLQHEPIAVDGVAIYHGVEEVLSLVLAHFLDAKRAHSRDPERALFAAAEPAFKDLDWA